MSNRIPAEVFPPGDFIREELEERGWSQADLARIMDRDESNVSKIIAGKTAVTPTTARELAEAFGTSPEFWLNLETSYQLSQRNESTGQVRRRARLWEMAPIADMQRRQWIRNTSDAGELEQELCRFFNIASIDERPQLSVAARDSFGADELTPAQLAWCFRALRLARAQLVSQFNEDRLSNCEKKLRALAAYPEEARHIQKVLADHGIRFVIVEPLPGSKIDGAAFWLDQGSPVIALSARFDRIDAFWFTLSHEFSHIRHRDSNSVDTELVGERDDPSEPTLVKEEAEQRADREAAGMLVPPEMLQSFILRVRPMYSKTRIVQFAHRAQVHPGIVVGQLQYRGEIKYSTNREMLVKIREIVANSSTTDGWGRVITIS